MKVRGFPQGFLDTRIKRGRYFFPGMLPSENGVALFCAGWEECHADFEIDRPSFRYEAIELLAGGEWEARVGRRSLRAGPGTLLAYGPRRPCALRSVGRGPHFKYFIDLVGQRSRELLRETGLAKRGIVVSSEYPRLAELLEQILSCAQLRGRQRNAVAAALTEAMLRRAAATGPAARDAGFRGREAFERCRAHLESDYPRIESIAAAARECHVTPPYFSRLFRRFAGTTAERFLASLRANHAARLLQQPGLTVKEAGLRVGFKDPYHFSRLFKRIHGVSPQKFRGG